MNNIIKSTDVLHKDKPVELEEYDHQEEPIKEPEIITYEVRVREGDSSDEYTVEAEGHYTKDNVIYFHAKDRIRFFVPLCNLCYVNIPEED